MWVQRGPLQPHLTPPFYERLLKHCRPAVQSTHLIRGDAHDTHFLSSLSSITPDVDSVPTQETLGIFSSQLKKTLGERQKEGDRVKKSRESRMERKEDNDIERLIN